MWGGKVDLNIILKKASIKAHFRKDLKLVKAKRKQNIYRYKDESFIYLQYALT